MLKAKLGTNPNLQHTILQKQHKEVIQTCAAAVELISSEKDIHWLSALSKGLSKPLMWMIVTVYQQYILDKEFLPGAEKMTLLNDLAAACDERMTDFEGIVAPLLLLLLNTAPSS